MNDVDLRRLTIAELKLAEHEKKHDMVQDSLARLADGLNALVQAEIRREPEIKAFSHLNALVQAISDKQGEQAEQISAIENAQLRRDLHTYRSLVWKAINWTIGIAAAVAAAYIAFHFGWAPPGV